MSITILDGGMGQELLPRGHRGKAGIADRYVELTSLAARIARNAASAACNQTQGRKPVWVSWTLDNRVVSTHFATAAR